MSLSTSPQAAPCKGDSVGTTATIGCFVVKILPYLHLDYECVITVSIVSVNNVTL